MWRTPSSGRRGGSRRAGTCRPRRWPPAAGGLPEGRPGQRRRQDQRNHLFRPLLDPLDLGGAVVTFDALLAQTDHAKFLVEDKGAHYIAVLKANHPTLHAAVKDLPWKDVPLMDRTWATTHGRDEIRRLKAATVPGLSFPHADQALQIVRRRRTVRTRKVTGTRLRPHQSDGSPGNGC